MPDPASLTLSAVALLVATLDKLVRWPRRGEEALRAELAALKERIHRLEREVDRLRR